MGIDSDATIIFLAIFCLFSVNGFKRNIKLIAYDSYS